MSSVAGHVTHSKLVSDTLFNRNDINNTHDVPFIYLFIENSLST